MNVEEETLRRIIRSEIGTAMDARFETFEFRIDKKMDDRFEAFESKIDTRFDNFELNLAEFFGKTQRHFDKQFNTFEHKFDKRFNKLQNSVDGIVKRLDDDDIERAAISNQLARHDTWVNQLALNTNTSLSAP